MELGLKALGVAIIGIVFYNAVGTHPMPASLPHAFIVSILLLVLFTIAVAEPHDGTAARRHDQGRLPL